MGYGRVILRFGDTSEGLLGFETGQPESYFMGSGLGLMTEKEIGVMLADASVDGLQKNASSFTERFERVDYGGGIRRAFGRQGRFQFHLRPYAGFYELRIEVFWDLDVSRVGSTAAEIITQANVALSQYWGAPLSSAVEGFTLKSEIDNKVIPIRPVILPLTGDSFGFEVTVVRDIDPLPLPYFEVVNMRDFEWAMRETLSFRPYQDHVEAGRGPHEYGHMMGIPHDVADPGTVMSTIAHPLTWRYFVDDGSNAFKSRAVPWASHFKLAKVWADSVFDSELGREEDFVIQTPYEEILP